MLFAASSSGLVTVLVALIASVTTLGTSYITVKLRQIHVLVNSRLDNALAEISALKYQAGVSAEERSEERRILGDRRRSRGV